MIIMVNKAIIPFESVADIKGNVFNDMNDDLWQPVQFDNDFNRAIVRTHDITKNPCIFKSR